MLCNGTTTFREDWRKGIRENPGGGGGGAQGAGQKSRGMLRPF